MRTLLLALGLTITAQAGLVHHYTFQGDVTDQVGTAHGTLIGGATATGGQLILDGVDDYVDFSVQIVPTSGTWSVLIKAAATSIPGITEMISQGFSGGPGFYMGTAGSTGMRMSDAWGSVPENFIQDGQLHQYALVMDTTEARFYIDGVLEQTHSTFTTTTGGSATRFGRQFSSYGEYFGGRLADVRIYDTALGESTIQATLVGTPEPSTLFALPAAALLAAGLRRRRKASAL